MKPDTPLYGPVCGFGGRVGERHQQDGLPAPLGACEPVVRESRGSGQPPPERKLVSPSLRERWLREIGDRQKKEKAGPAGPAKAAH